MSQADMISINNVAAKLGLSVHQLRRWELMFGLDIKRGRGQQRQYRPEDMSVLERIRELVEQGWPTTQIRPQLEAEGLITPKLIGLPMTPGSHEVMMESIIGLRSFCERRFIDLSKQIDDLRHLLISLSFKQELQLERPAPWQPLPEEIVPAAVALPAQEISLGPVGGSTTEPPSRQAEEGLDLPDITDQNYTTVLGRALDLVGWSDEQADQYCLKAFAVPHWDILGRSHAEKLIEHLKSLCQSSDNRQVPAEEMAS